MPMKDKVLEIMNGLNEVRDSHVKLDRILSSGPASFYFEKINSYIEGLFSFAKFKVGEPVCLAHDIDCNDKPGWLGAEHFLKKGATATVDELDFGKGGFTYGIIFDNETWIDSHKVARPVRDPHQFWFREADLAAFTAGQRRGDT